MWVVLFILAAFCGRVQPALSGTTRYEIQQFLDNVIKCGQVPQISAVLYDKGTPHYFQAGGGINEQTRFMIGSLTKAFTATLVAKLLKKKPEYTWDTPVKKILGGDFRLFNDVLTENVCLRDLLSHQTGVNDYEIWFFTEPNITRSEQIRRLRYIEPEFNLRQRAHYNNLMYVLAGHVASAIEGNGKTFEQLIREYILDPLGMKNSFFESEVKQMRKDGKLTNFAVPKYYKEDGKTLTEMDMARIETDRMSLAAGAIISSTEDMTKWLKWNLDNFKQPFVDPETGRDEKILQEVYTGQVPFWGNVFPDKYDTVKNWWWFLSFGWFHGVKDGEWYLEHSGGFPVFFSNIKIYPKLQQGVFLALTGRNEITADVSYYLMDKLRGIKSTHTVQNLCAKVFKLKVPALLEKPVHPIEKYVGKYGHKAFGIVEVKNIDGTLYFFYNKLKAVLKPMVAPPGYFYFDLYGELEYYKVSIGTMGAAFIPNDKGDPTAAVLTFFNTNVMFMKGQKIGTDPPPTSPPNRGPNVSIPNEGFKGGVWIMCFLMTIALLLR